METSKFDIADYLDSSEMIAEYLNTALEEGSDIEIVTAIGICQSKRFEIDKLVFLLGATGTYKNKQRYK